MAILKTYISINESGLLKRAGTVAGVAFYVYLIRSKLSRETWEKNR